MQAMIAAVLAAALSLAPSAGAAPWPDGYVQRLQALARLQALNAELLSHDSATAVLQSFCDRHGPRPGVKIAAKVQAGPPKPASVEQRKALGASPTTRLRYRRVALTCGDLVLSRADNWYRPDRLTRRMNELLEQTDTPFGRVVADLGYHRRTLAVQLLTDPLPPGWEDQPPQANATPFTPPAEILQHSAVLLDAHGRPFSLVVETYTDGLLLMTPPEPAT